ncbi:MAG: hypothetical protein K5798_09545 [Nitrosopumilus sp.]|uniref:hypothetical protein n=1 Tax=Nitrosopumilus sp. TaxID=2024843 RepID=UPI00242B8045|nr:hypothetical protein [Nitrosopumilus sp.]MCV0367487.1 hypothetical protein [Nitrosopumilus sp.]
MNIKERLDNGFVELIVGDLITKNLMDKGNYLHVTMSVSGMFSRRTTDLGQQFLSFIKSPLN